MKKKEFISASVESVHIPRFNAEDLYRDMKGAKRRVWVWSVSLSLASKFWSVAKDLKVDLRVLLADPKDHKTSVDNLLAEVAADSLKNAPLVGKFRLFDFPFYDTGFIVDEKLYLIHHEYMKRSSVCPCLITNVTDHPTERQFIEMWNSAKAWKYTSERLKHVLRKPPKSVRNFPDPSEDEC